MKRKLTNRLTALLLSALTVVSALPFLGWGMRVRAVSGADIASVPAVRSNVTTGSETFTLTTESRFFIAADSDPSKTDVGLFVQTVSSEFASKGIPSANVMSIVYGNEKLARTGDIIIIPDSKNVDKAQGYKLTVTSSNITIEAKDAAGVLNGLHTVLQSMVRGGTTLNACTVNDWPDVAERSVYLDCGRVYFKPETIKALIRTLSWNKMNVLYLDFSNNNATRFFLNKMEVTVDGTTYDITKAKPTDYLSQSDMDGIIAEANKYGVQIIPTFNSPGHIGGILGAFTEDEQKDYFDIKDNTDYDQISKGGKGKVTLLIENETAYKIGIEVNKLYINYFAEKGCKSYNIAADEATLGNVKYDSDNKSFVKYVNELNSYIKSKGMTTRMFNDGIESVDCSIDKDITVLYWGPDNNAAAYLNSKRNFVNFSYGAGLYYAYLGGRSAWWVWNQSVSQLYASWTPGVTNRDTDNSYTYDATESVDITNDYFLGANFAIWTDYAFVDGINGTDLLAKNSYDVMQKIYTVAEKSWTSENNTRASSYSAWSGKLNTAPAGLSLSGSVLTDKLPTPSAITLEATMNCVVDSEGVVKVYAPGIDGLEVSSIRGESGIADAKASVLYRVKPTVGDAEYTGKGVISIKVPDEMKGKTVMGVVLVNGKLTTVSGAVNTDENGDQWLTFDAPSFPATYGLAQVNYSGDPVYIKVSIDETETVQIDGVNLKGNTYTPAPEGIAKVSVDGKDAAEGDVTLGDKCDMTSTQSGVISDGTNYLVVDSKGNISNTTEISNATKFTVSRSSRYYVIKTSNYYLTIDANDYSLKASSSSSSLQYNSNYGFYVTDSNSRRTYYSVAFNGGKWTTNKSSAGAFLYSINESEPTPASTTLTFKGLKAGTATVIINNTLYYITVKNNEIEIPITIVDYRADGLLFEFGLPNSSIGYQLVHSAPSQTESAAANAIGNTTLEKLVSKDNAAGRNQTWIGSNSSEPWYGGGNYIRTGLVSSTLGANGMPVYTDDAVKYVAGLLSAGYSNQSDLSKSTISTNWNSILYETFLKDGTERSVVGTSTTAFSSGFEKVKTYDNIKTAYDLAWYLLNTIFMPDTNMATVTDKNDTTKSYDVPIYGMAVNAYDKIVLTKNSSGNYYMSAYQGKVEYDTDARVIKNGSNVASNEFFYPINGLGYDALFGDTTDTTVASEFSYYGALNPNGNYTLRGQAQFVYNSADNLFFDFTGDDDVYLFINGHLVLDLGGAHWSVEKRVDLNDVAKECGLKDGEVATFTFFYMERFSDCSNFAIETNIELAAPAISVDKKAYNGTYSDANEITSGSAISHNTDVLYDLIVKNVGDLPMSNLRFTDTDTIVNDSKTINEITINGTGVNKSGNDSRAVLSTDGPFTVRVLNGTAVVDEQVLANADALKTYLSGLTLQSGYELHIIGVKGKFSPAQNAAFRYENKLTVVGTAAGSDLTGSALHELYVYNISNTGMAYVVDFGLPLTIKSLFDATVPATDMVQAVRLSTKTGKNNFKFGEVKLSGTGRNAQLTYTLTKAINSAEKITLELDLVFDGVKLPSSEKEITIIPATTVYYEDDFSDFITFDGVGCNWTTDGKTVTKEQSADRINHGGNVYGYDQAYDTMSKFSLGSAHKVTVSGSNYATAKFSFYGTGFDVISATTNTSATIVVTVTDAEGKSKNYLVDTYYGYEYVNGEWKVVADATKALWQIPVMKIANLDYGKYDVTITVAYADFFSHGQKDGKSYDFWLDAIRIYDPAGAVAGAAGSEQANYDKAYGADGEGWPTYKELRDMIIDAKSFDEKGSTTGMIFIDGQSGNVSMADYTSYGPNNELYLAKDQAVAFRLEATGKVDDIQIALKNIVDGKNASYKIFAVGGDATATELKTATDMYHSIKGLNGSTVVIMNVGDADSILSITNLKVTYTEKPSATDTFSITMDSESALAALSAVDEVLNPKTPFEPGKVDVKVDGDEVTVITSPDVDEIEIDGEKITESVTDPKTGNKIWKKTIRNLEYNPEISVVARDKNGNTSAPVTAPVVSGGSIGSLFGGFIGRLIRNILSALFG